MAQKPTYEELEQQVREFEQKELAHQHLNQMLQESREKFQILSEQSIMSIVIIQEDGFKFVNDAYLRLTGYSKDEILAMSIADTARLVHPDDRDFVMEQGRKKMSGETQDSVLHYTYRGITKSGEEKWVEQFSKSIVWEEKPADLMTLIDVTRHKLAEKTLQESEERYRDIFNNLIDVFFTTTVDGIIENVSPSAEDVLGYSVKELIGKKTDLLYQNPEDREKFLNRLKKKGQVRGFELVFKKKNNELCTISVNATLNYNKDGEASGLSGTIRDITELKRAATEKLNAQKIASEHEKLALVGQIAGKMAHDFNNVLGIIMGNTELALLDCEDSQIKKTLELIYKQTERGKNLTKNLVAFAKDQELKQAFFRMTDKIDLVLNLMKKDLEGIELTREDKPGVPELLADPGMIEHALVNLIQNAIHATSLTEFPRIILRTYCREDLICFEIEDNGCGISNENLKHIFKPSFTLKGSKDVTGSYESSIKGTGYGMANVKKYIEQHKGDIFIKTEYGAGTKFTIHLPVIKKKLTRDEKQEIRKSRIQSGKYILLVEDEQAMSDIQYRILTQEPCHHKVDIAINGQVAMDLFDRNSYDFVSLDYILPGNISGKDVYHYIRKADKEIPILFVSGNIEFLESLKDLKQKDPNIDNLSKPYPNKEYVSSINSLMERSSG